MLSFFSRKSPDKLFLSLVISEGTVAGALWKASSEEQNVLQYSRPVPWDSEAENSLIDSSDVALDELGTQVNSVKEVLLGLPESWATGLTIAAEKKSLLKKLADQLNLKSVGFVIVPEAITALFREREKAGLNALLIFVSEKTVQLLPILHGQSGTQAKVGRSDSLVKDIIEGCARGNYSSLPGRILLASQDLTEAQMTSSQQELQATEWKDKLFLHHPRVDLVPPQMILDAVSLSGGKEVALALGISKAHQEATETEIEEDSQSQAFDFKPIEEEKTIEKETPVTEESHEKLDVGGLMPSKRKFPKALMLVILAFFLFAGIVGAAYFGLATAARAEVFVLVKTKSVSFDSTLTIDANASESNPEANILKATKRTKEVTDTSEALTTGSKIIGDKAKGAVTIYNRTTVGSKIFLAGTILKLDEKVQFTLDADVTVPIGTPDNGLVGKASAKVTAVNFGAESNIDKGVQLSIGGFDQSSFYALTEDKFAGGTSRTVQVVSEADQKKLADALYARLKQQALASFNSEISPEENVVLSDVATVTKKQFSDDIGKEVKSFTLTMTVAASAIVYSNQDISVFATAKLASQIPQGAVLQADKTVIEIKEQKNISDSKSLIRATISSVIIPAFDEEKISQLLSGKTLEDAYGFLDSHEGIASYKVAFKPSFAGNVLGKFPSQSKNIKVTVTE